MKYLAPVLAVLLIAALLLVPTSRAVAPAKPFQESAACETVSMSIDFNFSTSQWSLFVIGAHGKGPYLIFYGTTLANGTYKGCVFGPTPQVQAGPFVDDLHVVLPPPGSQYNGYWQAIGEDWTSNTFLKN